MTLKLITFKTNQTILGQIDCTTDNEIVIKKPVQVIVQPSKEGPMIGFAPFLEYSQEFVTGIKVPSDTILCITTPVTELENQYNQVFGSGIQIASSIPKM
jgi:hypothetical protein